MKTAVVCLGIVLCGGSLLIAGGKQHNPDHYPSIAFGLSSSTEEGTRQAIGFGAPFLEPQDFESDRIAYWIGTTLPLSESWSFNVGLTFWDGESDTDETFNWLGGTADWDGREIWVSFRYYFNKKDVHGGGTGSD